MNKGQSVIAGLLAAAVALLAVNVLVMGSRSAEAQGEVDDGEPYVVKYLAAGAFRYRRVWSDGRVDEWSRPNEAGNCDWTFEGVIFEGIDYRSPVVDANGGGGGIVQVFEDGRVDFVVHAEQTRCTIVGKGGSPPLCTGDIDRDGTTGMSDLLTVLGGWGCEQ